jgi:hypothetical protein
MRRVLLTLGLVAAGLTAPSLPHAVACSCDTSDTREVLPRADGAFVGTLLAIEELSTAERQSFPREVRYRLRVERALKGDIAGPEVDVYSWPGGGSCGFDDPVGSRLGMLLSRDGQHWTSELCSQEDPDVLVRAAQPLPPPDGRAPPAVLVGTTHGPGRMLSFDGAGRVVAYGGGDGAVTDIAFCPGNGALAEAYSLDPGSLGGAPFSGLAIRSAGDLAVIDQQEIDGEALGPVALADIACRGREATDVVAFVVDDSHPGGYPDRYRGRVLSWAPHGDRLREVWQGPAQAAVFTPEGTSVYVNGGPEGRDLLRIDLTDLDRPVAHPLVRLPAGTGPLALAPGGRHLAGTTSNSYNPPPDGAIKAVIVDLAASPVRVAEYGLGNRDSGTRYGQAVWSGPDRVVFAPNSDESEVQVFDTALTPVASWSGWGSSGGPLAVVGDRLLGLVWRATIEVAPLVSGPVTRWADLEGGIPGTLVAFPGGAPIESAEPSPTSTTHTNGDGGSSEAAGPGGGRSGTAGRPLLFGGAGVVALAAGVVALVRRRRRGIAVLP